MRQNKQSLLFFKFWWFLGILAFLIITALFLIPIPRGTKQGIPHLDKLIHLIVHFSLCFYFTGLDQKRRVFIFFLFYGVFIELLQNLSPHRSMDLLDMLANSAGDILGLILGAIYSLKLFQCSESFIKKKL